MTNQERMEIFSGCRGEEGDLIPLLQRVQAINSIKPKNEVVLDQRK